MISEQPLFIVYRNIHNEHQKKKTNLDLKNRFIGCSFARAFSSDRLKRVTMVNSMRTGLVDWLPDGNFIR